jgi:hypothetical protein
MQTLTNFTTLAVTPSSLLTGTAASYTFTFTHGLTIPSSSQIELAVVLPSSLTLVSCNSCSNYSAFAITSSSNTVTMSSVTNPEGATCTGGIVVSLKVDGYLSIQDVLSCPAYTPATLAYSVQSNSSFLGEPVSINITISSLPLLTTYLILAVPPEYSLSSPAVTSPQLSLATAATGNSLNLTISSVAAQRVTLMLEGATNPVSPSSSSWSIQSYNGAYSLIAQSSASVVFSAPCGTTCRDCLNTTYCLNCYSNPLVNSLPKLDYSLRTCISACSSSQYLVNEICFSCSGSCLTCALTSDNCTSCSSSYLLGTQCLPACPEGYYSTSTLCLICNNNCLVCNSSSVCLNCQPGYLLQSNSSCLPSCPSGEYNMSNTCTSCPGNCTSCNESGCTACSPSYLLCNVGAVVCLLSCPQGYYLSLNGSWC